MCRRNARRPPARLAARHSRSSCLASCCSSCSLIAGVWIARRPIATRVLQDAVRAARCRAPPTSSTASACARRRSATSSSAIPKNPDLVARYAQIQLRWTMHGQRRRLSHRRARRSAEGQGRGWPGRLGRRQQDASAAFRQAVRTAQLRPRHRRQQHRLQTPMGPVGFALAGTGNLTGGFKGRLAAVSPRPRPGPLPARRRCGPSPTCGSSRGARTSTGRSSRTASPAPRATSSMEPRASSSTAASTRASPASTARRASPRNASSPARTGSRR